MNSITKNQLSFQLMIASENLNRSVTKLFVRDHNDFALFDYESDPANHWSQYELGDVVTRRLGDQVEIGVIIQLHPIDEFRTDMFGNEGYDNVKPSTLEEIEIYRPTLLKDLVMNVSA